MDFTPGEAEMEAARRAAEILAAATSAKDDEFDARLWKDIGDAGLLALAMPADLGGEGSAMAGSSRRGAPGTP